MTSNTKLTNLNTNIDDYSIEELYNLLELEEFTREQIIISVNYLTTNVFNNNETIKEFFLNIQDKLLNYLTTYNSSFDNLLHANANSNIETNNDDMSETSDVLSETIDNLKEGFDGLNMESDHITSARTNDTIQPLSNFVISNVLRKKKFYFDTTQKIYSNEDPTNCKMYVQRTINVMKATLISLTCKVPLLIHTSKLNNFFTIQKFVGSVCDFSAQIIIDDGYYEESVSMAEAININIQKKANSLLSEDSAFNFLKDLTFSFNYLNKSVFELNYNQQTYDISYYSIDFTSTANTYYALSNILGFTSASIITSDIITNTGLQTLTSPKPYNTISNKLPFFFCFEDNNHSIISNYICRKANIIQSRVLARIAPLTCPQTSNTLSTKFNEFNSNTLLYNGRVNIENFTVKIIDIYGNILLSIDNDYCFEIEFECEELTSTSNSSNILPNLV
jgi:hypothetical protein|uniref:Uncharacterized protein n=1 Tax=viral metagenome TaxID=1070528 RepID=A0A6C0CC68_9ZZZZ